MACAYVGYSAQRGRLDGNKKGRRFKAPLKVSVASFIHLD